MKRLAFTIGLAALAMVVAANGHADDKEAKGDQPSAAAVTADRPWLRLISQEEFMNTMSAVFGSDNVKGARFAPMKRTQGLVAISANSAGVTSGSFEQFEGAANAIAERVVGPNNQQFLIPCRLSARHEADTVCTRRFFSKVGRLLYRRPLTNDEVKAYVDRTSQISERIGFQEGLAYTLAGMIVSPEVIFIRDETVVKDGHETLTPYAKATRLSLLLWRAYPEDQLLNAAAKGELDTKAGLTRQVDRMLASPRLEAGMRAFFSDWLILDDFVTLSKDSTIFPAFSPQVVAGAKEQILRTIIDHLIVQDADYRDLFTTRKTMISGGLGVIYHVPVDKPLNWTPYESPPGDMRAGILTLPGFLALYSHPGRTSPTKRGRAVREIFLCQKVPDPPPNVDFSAVDDPKSPFNTARERLEFHRKNAVCAGCHKITDPIGLAFENFDGAGQFRATERGAKIDASGTLNNASYTDAVGLGKVIHDDPAATACLVNRLFAYAVGRPTGAKDSPELEDLRKQFADDGFKLKPLLRDIATSDALFAVSKPVSQPSAKQLSARSN
jgi:Protein of unknown function (DUF1592)/Protein of unknown function (DUF1588)/Protein of unknown function (DUF1585)/Protein of unknown function (DUF1595)